MKLINRFQILQDLEDSEIEDHWNRVKEAFQETCEEVLGRSTNNNKPWITQESLDKIKERRNLKAVMNNSRTRAEKVTAQEK